MRKYFFGIFFAMNLSIQIFSNEEAFNLNLKDYTVCFVDELDQYFYIDTLEDGIKCQLSHNVPWEKGIHDLICKYAVEGSTVIDIGAHIGLHSIAMSKKVGCFGQVIAFEPQKKMHAELLLNLRLNHCNNVIAYRKALGAEEKDVELSIRNPYNEGGTKIGKGGDYAHMIRLDSLKLENVSLIKIDVEQYEWFVLVGAKETILKNKPVIIFEVMGGFDYIHRPPEWDQILNLVESFGYDIELIFGNDYIATPKIY